jgi:hypothetical protein
MDIRFKGETLSGKILESDSILQGKKVNGIRIFLKASESFPKWVECKPETVEQLNVFTKKQLSEAWHHGAVRSPRELMHCNNFDVYFKHRHNDNTK